MKATILARSLILAAAAALSLNAGAARADTDTDTIASYGVFLGVQDGHPTAARITVAGDGQLTITKTVQGQPVVGSTVTAQLAPEALNLLKTKIEQLSNADIATTTSQVVCMMMPVWGSADRVLEVRRGYDYNNDVFGGALSVIDNNAGCWSRTHIQPKQAYDLQTAKELEAQLDVLTAQTVPAID